MKKIPSKRIGSSSDSGNPWNSTENNKNHAWRALAFMSLFPILAILWRPILRVYGNWLSTANFTGRADVAIVIDSSKQRVEAAVQLLRQDKVNRLFINSISRENFNKLVEQYDLSPAQVYWGGCRATTTYAQPFYFLQAHEHYDMGELESILIISDKYHLRRSKWSYKTVLSSKGMHPQVQTYASPSDAIRDNLDWWQYEYAKSWVNKETQKNLFYLINYGLLNKENEDITSSSLFKKTDPKELAAYLAKKELQCGEFNHDDPLDRVPIQKR